MMYKDKEKQKEYQKLWIKNRRDDWFKDKCCISCGTKENLQLDHIKTVEKFTHRIWSYSKEKRDKELEKCQVLCESCHLKKTISDPNTAIPYIRKHGTQSMYNKYRCRCDECLEWRKRKYRKEK